MALVNLKQMNINTFMELDFDSLNDSEYTELMNQAIEELECSIKDYEIKNHEKLLKLQLMKSYKSEITTMYEKFMNDTSLVNELDHYKTEYNKYQTLLQDLQIAFNSLKSYTPVAKRIPPSSISKHEKFLKKCSNKSKNDMEL